MDIVTFKELIRAKRDGITIVAVLLFVLIGIIVVARMQKHYGSGQTEEEAAGPPEKVILARPAQNSAGGQEGGEKDRRTTGQASPVYLLKPTAEEVLTMIRETGQEQLPQESQDYLGFRVMWPCYFFQIQRRQGAQVTVMFDVSEDGFGPTIVTEIDSSRFPGILEVESGKKLWLAGEIIAIDPVGTGIIHMVTEEVRFAENLQEAISTRSDQQGQQTGEER